MYPLRFEPIFRRYIWGGHRLAGVLNKPAGDESCAESWEIVDHNSDQSVVAFGYLAGKTLHQLVVERGDDLLGSSEFRQLQSSTVPEHLRLRFPLLLKFLDASNDLSVQVHPDDALAATLDPPDLGKTEAWYVIDATAGSQLYTGLKSGVTELDFRRAIGAGAIADVLHHFEPRPGDCVLIRAGTVHAIGAGLLIAEIQQASDTTYRIFDWNRLDVHGNPRPLHIKAGIAATNFAIGPVKPITPKPTTFPNAWEIVSCEQFEMQKWNVGDPIEIGGDGRFRIVTMIGGSVHVNSDPAARPLRIGETILIPACMPPVRIEPLEASQFLEIYVPSSTSKRLII